MKMSENEIKEYIRTYYEKHHTEYKITERILSRITAVIAEGLANASRNISKETEISSIETFLEKNNVLQFVGKRQPNTESIPEQVIHSLNMYFEKYLPGYELCHVYRKSNYQEDNYLYCLTARNADGKYVCWSSWNSLTESLNQGHYNLSSEMEGIHILLDLFNDVTDEPDKYGMLKAAYENQQDRDETHEEETHMNNIVERHSRHIL